MESMLMNNKQDIDAGSLNHQLIENDLFKNSNINVEFFNNLRLNIINLKKGEILFREGDFANSIFLILDGDINLINKHAAENNCIFYTKNNFFGNSEYLQLCKRNSTAVALKNSRLAELSREDIEYLKTKDHLIIKNLKQERAFEEVPNHLDHFMNPINNLNAALAINQNLTPSKQPLQHPDSNSITIEDSKMNNRNSTDLNKIKSDINIIINNLIEHSSVLEEEQKKIRQLLAEYESDNKKLHIEIGKLKEQKESFINLNKEKTEILGYQSYRIIELEKEITNLKSSEGDHSKNLELLNAQLIENERKIKSLETELETKKGIVAALEKNFEDSKKTLSYLNEVQIGLIQKADEQEEIVKQQNIKLNESLAQIEATTYDLQKKENFIAELKNALLEKDKFISELNENGNKLGEDLKTKQQRISLLTSDLAQMESHLTELRNELFDKNKLLSDFSEKEQKINDDLKNFQNHVSTLSSDIANKDSKLTALDSELAEKNRIILEFGEKELKLKADISDLQKKMESLKSAVSSKEQIVADLKNDLQNKSSIIAENATSILKAKDELNKLRQSNSAFEETVKQQSNKITDLQKEIFNETENGKGSKEKLLDLQKKFLSLEEQLKNVLEQSAQKEESIKKLTSESKSISDNLKQKDSEIANRNRSIDELKNELLTLKKTSENFSNKENVLKKEIVDLKFHLSKANSKLASFAEQISEKAKLDESREKETREIKKQLEDQSLLLKEKDREVGDLLLLLQQRENEVLELNNLKAEHSSQKTEYASLNENFGRLKNENTYLSEQLKNLKQQIEAFRNDQNNLLRISADYNRLKDEEEAFKNSFAENEKLLTQQREEYSSLNEILNTVKSENQHLTEQLNSFKLQIKENDNEFNKLLKINVEHNRLKDETERHKKVLAEKEQIIKEQSNVIEDLKLNNSEILQTLSVTKNKVGDELGIKENRILILENSLNDLKIALEEKTAFEGQQAETINNQAQKIAELELKLSDRNSIKDTSSPEGESTEKLTPDNEEQSEISDDDKVFSKCKLIRSKPVDPDVMHETFEHFQYFDIHIVNVNLTRATIDMVSVFNEFLQEIVGKDENRIIVNLSQCEFIDSSFLGLLVANLKKVTAMGGDMRLVGFHPTVASMMQLTRMDKIFEFYPKVESALKSFG